MSNSRQTQSIPIKKVLFSQNPLSLDRISLSRISPRKRLVLALWGCFLLGLILAQTAVGQSIKLRMHLKLDGTGRAQTRYELKLSPPQYAMLKQTMGDAFFVIRSMESNKSWLDVENIDARFDDRSNSVQCECVADGMLRTVDEGKWVLDIGTQAEGIELLDIRDGQAVFCSADSGPTGIICNYMTVEMPKGSRDAAYDPKSGQLSYSFDPEFAEGDRSRVVYDLQATERILSCLGKIYGKQDSDLCAAEHDFTNVGDQPVYNFRVRFRIQGYSSWSRWKRCAVVYPGQKVRDCFYPVLDVDKLTQLTGTRQAMLESEIEYTTVDGEKMTDSDSRRLEILSRNEIIFSTRRNRENISWYERYNLAPYLVTCFTDGTDPVIQQFVGRISVMANGPAAAQDNASAIKFLSTVWLALKENQVAYQTPPSLSYDEHFGQHIKYARDVLRNRAGTCVDLAIFWASVAESVGLKPHIFVVEGHAFPAVAMPNGQLLPIEATMMGKHTFEEAVTEGFQKIKKARARGLVYDVDIASMKASGIRSLDLPRLDENVLSEWGYKFEMPESKTPEKKVATTRQKPANETNSTNETTPERQVQPERKLPKFVGLWKMRAVVNGITLEGAQVFTPDGAYGCEVTVTYPNGQKEKTSERGTYTDQGTFFKFNTNVAKYDQKYRWNGDHLQMYFKDLGVWIQFDRVQQ